MFCKRRGSSWCSQAGGFCKYLRRGSNRWSCQILIIPLNQLIPAPKRIAVSLVSTTYPGQLSAKNICTFRLQILYLSLNFPFIKTSVNNRLWHFLFCHWIVLIAGFRPRLYLLSRTDLTLKKCLEEMKASIHKYFLNFDLLWITGLSSRRQDISCWKRGISIWSPYLKSWRVELWTQTPLSQSQLSLHCCNDIDTHLSYESRWSICRILNDDSVLSIRVVFADRL